MSEIFIAALICYAIINAVIVGTVSDEAEKEITDFVNCYGLDSWQIYNKRGQKYERIR